MPGAFKHGKLTIVSESDEFLELEYDLPRLIYTELEKLEELAQKYKIYKNAFNLSTDILLQEKRTIVRIKIEKGTQGILILEELYRIFPNVW